MCACPSSFITDAWASTAPCTLVQLWATSGGQTATCRPLPPPPFPKGAVTWVVCPLAPPAYVDSSTATRVNNPGRAALSEPQGANPPLDATRP